MSDGGRLGRRARMACPADSDARRRHALPTSNHDLRITTDVRTGSDERRRPEGQSRRDGRPWGFLWAAEACLADEQRWSAD